MASLPAPADGLTSHPVDVGQRTEAIVLAALAGVATASSPRSGRTTAMTSRSTSATAPSEGSARPGRLRRDAILCHARSIRSNTRGTYCRSYDDQIDLFFVYCPETDGVHAVPVEDATATVGTLRVAPTANRQAKRIRWAKDYELPE
jgi:PD-(D/E)XK nuclease superfamily protein